jgi:hypothetical protein
MKTIRLVLLGLGLVLLGYLVSEVGSEAVVAPFHALSWRLLPLLVFPFGLIAALHALGWQFPFRAIVANVPTYRGFLTLTPEATPFDGLLDVLAVPPLGKRALAALLLAFLFHLPRRWQGVVCRRASRVSVWPRGEAAEEVGVMPRALPVLVPLACARHLEPAAGEVAPGLPREGRAFA